MNLTFSKHTMIEKMVTLADWVTRGRWQIISAQKVDELRTEIYQLEKTLAAAPTRPTRLVKATKPLEPVTEQQKIVDMAG